MTTSLKLRRGTTAQHAAFTGAEGEVTVDTTKDTVVVHDGATAGGFPLAKEKFRVSGTGTVDRTLDTKLKDRVSVKDFGAVGDGSTDDTAAIQAAINHAISTSKHLDIPFGFYSVSSVIIDGANGMTIEAHGALIGKTTGTYDAVLTITNSVDMTIYGKLGVSGSYNTGYGAAIWIHKQGAGSTSFLMLDNVVVSGARVGWKFGSTTSPSAVVSEITIKGGYTYGCPIAVEALGSETVVNFMGSILHSSTGAGTGAWLTLTRLCIKSVGAFVGVLGGEVLMVDNTTGAAVLLQPILSTSSLNVYGSVALTQVLLESASQYLVISNPSSLSPISPGGNTRFIGCSGYHAGNFASMVSISSDYDGAVSFLNNNFYAGSARTLGNIDASTNTKCHIYCDEQSFGNNFLKGLVGIAGGVVHFDRRLIFKGSNCVTQSLPLNTETTLKYQAVYASPDTNRFSANYSTSTGLFTVPAGGLKAVSLTMSFRSSQAAQPVDIVVKLNGTFVAVIKSGTEDWPSGTVELGDLAAGTTIGVAATQYGAAGTTAGGGYEYMAIVARN